MAPFSRRVVLSPVIDYCASTTYVFTKLRTFKLPVKDFNAPLQISLINKTLLEAQQILKTGSATNLTNLTIEYDVSVMQSVEFSLGPLLIEIERPMNDSLGLMLSNYSNCQTNDMGSINDVVPAGVYVASILAASIADRYFQKEQNIYEIFSFFLLTFTLFL